MEIYTITKDSMLYRVEGSKAKGAANQTYKFYAYFRDPSVCKNTHWTHRCENNGYCKFIEASPKKDINLLVIPYKTVLYHYPDKNDKILGARLKRIARYVYKKGSEDFNCAMFAIDDLILQKERSYTCPELNPDYSLIKLLCKAGLDGWIRTVNGHPKTSPTDCLDEVAICYPDTKIKIKTETMILKK